MRLSELLGLGLSNTICKFSSQDCGFSIYFMLERIGPKFDKHDPCLDKLAQGGGVYHNLVSSVSQFHATSKCVKFSES